MLATVPANGSTSYTAVTPSNLITIVITKNGTLYTTLNNQAITYNTSPLKTPTMTYTNSASTPQTGSKGQFVGFINFNLIPDYSTTTDVYQINIIFSIPTTLRGGLRYVYNFPLSMLVGSNNVITVTSNANILVTWVGSAGYFINNYTTQGSKYVEAKSSDKPNLLTGLVGAVACNDCFVSGNCYVTNNLYFGNTSSKMTVSKVKLSGSKISILAVTLPP